VYDFHAVEFIARLNRHWGGLTSPHPEILDSHARSRARVLATVLLFSAGLDLLFSLGVIPAVYGREGLVGRPEWWLPTLAFPASLALWKVARGRHPRRAALGLSIFATVSTWTFAAAILGSTPDSRELQRILVPILLAQLFAGTFLPFRFSVQFGVANLLGLTLIPLVTIHLPLAETVGTALLFGVGVVTIVAVSWLHRHDLQTIRQEQADRASAEDALERARRLESLGRLAGGVAHDFNNMLTAIFARLDACRLADPPLAIARELDGIETAADRAAGLVKRLLDQGRPRHTRRVAIDMVLLARETVEIVRPSLGQGIRIELVESPGTFEVVGDPDQLAQVLVNLLGNARDALAESSREGGVITLSTGHPPSDVASHPGCPPGAVAWVVDDTGPGFSPTMLEHLFEPFFTTKGAGKGTGLGLWNCLGTVRAHQGELLAHNLPRGGARLTVLLPAVSDRPGSEVRPSVAEPAPRPAPIEPAAETSRPRILLVDDEETIREHGALVLRESGFEVVVAGTGERALDRFETEASGFDLVVLDLSLPGISGRETCARILARAPEQKVLIVTGFDLGSGQAEPDVAGASGRLLKPFRMGRLVEEVRRLVAPPR